MTKLLARQEAGETISADLRLLMHSAKKSYEKVKVELDALIAKGVMRYDKLWYFLPPGCVVFRSQCGVPMCVILNDCMDTVDPLGRASMQVRCHHIAGGENGMKGMQMHKMCYIRYFSGERNIAELEVYPLKYHADAEGIREGLIKRGREYASFAQNQPYHMQYNGKYYYDDGSIAHHVAMVEGRIMVDWRGFGRYPPGEDGFHGMVRRKQDGGWDELTDDEALICDPAVPGYSLTGNFFGKSFLCPVSQVAVILVCPFADQRDLPHQGGLLSTASVRSNGTNAPPSKSKSRGRTCQRRPLQRSRRKASREETASAIWWRFSM